MRTPAMRGHAYNAFTAVTRVREIVINIYYNQIFNFSFQTFQAMTMHIGNNPEALLGPNDPVSRAQFQAHYVQLREENVPRIRRSIKSCHAAVSQLISFQRKNSKTNYLPLIFMCFFYLKWHLYFLKVAEHRWDKHGEEEATTEQLKGLVAEVFSSREREEFLNKLLTPVAIKFKSFFY